MIDPTTAAAAAAGAMIAKPAGEIAKLTAERTFNFLSRLLGPSVDAAGVLLRDRLTATLAAVTAGAEEQLRARGLEAGQVQVHPRLGVAIIEQAAWAEDDRLREMWTGLLVSSAAERPDEANLMFINLLSQLTSLQARILSFGSEHSRKLCTKWGLVGVAAPLHTSSEELKRITGESDLQRIDRELDHLRGLGLLGDRGGFQLPFPFRMSEEEQEPTADIAPTALALQMYVRCAGGTDPAAHFNLTPGAGMSAPQVG